MLTVVGHDRRRGRRRGRRPLHVRRRLGAARRRAERPRPAARLEIPVDVGDFPVQPLRPARRPVGVSAAPTSRVRRPRCRRQQARRRARAPVRGTERLERISTTASRPVTSGPSTTVTAAGGLGLFTNGVKAGAHEPIDGETWRLSAAIHSLMVDGRRAYTSAAIPQFEFGTDQFWTPAGFEGMQSSIALDAATGALTVTSQSGSSAARPPTPSARGRRTAARSSTRASGSSAPSR